MIKYKGRDIYFIQYIPLKTIKHGMKYFCVLCAYTLVLLGYLIYFVSEDLSYENNAVGIYDRPIYESHLTTERVSIFYTNNW